MHLVLSFVHPSRPSRTLGPFSKLWFDSRSLRAAADGPVLADHVGREWYVEGESYYRLDCAARVSIGFERGNGERSRVFGPFSGFSAVDGLVYTGSKVFAFLDRSSGAWLCYDLGEHYPFMMVAEAPAVARSSLAALAALAPLAGGVCGLWSGTDMLHAAVADGSRGALRPVVARHVLRKGDARHARIAELCRRCGDLLARLESGAARRQLLVEEAREHRARSRAMRAASRHRRAAGGRPLGA